MAEAYRLNIDTRQLRVLIGRTRGPFGGPEVQAALADGVRRWGLMVQTRAVHNVGGYPVVYEGGVFRVRVQTGALKGSITLQWPYGSRYTARVFVNGTATATSRVPGAFTRARSVAEYAGSIEWGHRQIDLKPYLRGKTVPFFAARGARARGPYAATGLEPLDPDATGYGSGWQSQVLNRKLAAKNKPGMVFTKKGGNPGYRGAGRGASTYFIAFRKVGDRGWVVPEAKPRPFMRAALEGTREQGRRMLVRAVVNALDPTR